MSNKSESQWTLDALHKDTVECYRQSSEKWPKQQALVDDTLDLLERADWSHYPLTQIAAQQLASMKARRELVDWSSIADPEFVELEIERQNPDAGQAIAMPRSAVAVMRSFATATLSALQGKFVESVGSYRSTLEGLLHVRLLLDRPEIGWLYMRNEITHPKFGHRSLYKEAQRLRTTWRKLASSPGALDSFQQSLLGFYNNAIHMGAHAGPILALWNSGDIRRGPTSLREEYSFVDIGNPHLGHYLSLYVHAVLELVNCLVGKHCGMKKDIWDQGYANLLPIASELREVAKVTVSAAYRQRHNL